MLLIAACSVRSSLGMRRPSWAERVECFDRLVADNLGAVREIRRDDGRLARAKLDRFSIHREADSTGDHHGHLFLGVRVDWESRSRPVDITDHRLPLTVENLARDAGVDLLSGEVRPADGRSAQNANQPPMRPSARMKKMTLATLRPTVTQRTSPTTRSTPSAIR